MTIGTKDTATDYAVTAAREAVARLKKELEAEIARAQLTLDALHGLDHKPLIAVASKAPWHHFGGTDGPGGCYVPKDLPRRDYDFVVLLYPRPDPPEPKKP